MLKSLRYVFYKGSKLSFRLGRRNTAFLMVLLATPILFNAMTITDSICILTKSQLPSDNILAKFIIVIISILIYLSVYQYLDRNGNERVRQIHKEFENVTIKQEILYSVIAIAYIAITLYLFFYTADIMRAKEYLYW